jgi:hypothetical protein
LEQSTDLKPKISIILPALMGYDSVLAALDSWDAQTSRSDMEIVVLCPAAPDHPVPSHHTIIETGSAHLHQARAAGIRKATADYVILAEDHCLPDPDCVEVILRRLDEGWDAVGPSLRPGYRHGALAQGVFLISYGQWMLPAGGSVAHLPGHNAALRRQPLIDMGAGLEDDLLIPLFLMRRLHSKGQRFCVDSRTGMRHFDVPQWRTSAEIFFAVGMGCGAVRLARASTFTRVLYAAITPVTAARHFARGLIQYVRAGRRAGFGVESIVTGGIFACVWALGESVGAWRGVERVTPDLWISEIKPVSREQAAMI